MEDDDENEQGLIRSWMKQVLTYTSFNFESLLTRQILSAISGILVNLLVTRLLLWFVDVDFRSTSLKWTLLVILVFMLLAFVVRCLLIKFKSVDWWSTPVMAMDMGGGGGGGDEMNDISQETSDYSVFTSFRFPVPANLLPSPQRVPVAEADTEPHTPSQSLSESQLSPPQRQTRPPRPSYQPQWVTSVMPTKSSSPSSHNRFLPSAPPSPITEKGKLRGSTSRQTTRLKNMNPTTSLLHRSLLHPLNPIPRKTGLVNNNLRNRDRIASGSSSSQSRSWAWEFMEKASFDQFKRDYANFRNINSSLLGAFATDKLRSDASRWIKGRGESDATERPKAQVLLSGEDHHQLQKQPPAPAPAPAQARAPMPPAFLQAVTPEVNPAVRKLVERKAKCAGCLKTCMPSFCFQRRKREQRRWNSRRFRQISHAPLLWSPIHPPITTTMTSPPTIRCI